jgi:hypothetical protein
LYAGGGVLVFGSLIGFIIIIIIIIIIIVMG